MGVQLGDLLVSIAVTGLVLGGACLLLQQGEQAYAIGAARVETQQGVRLALERLAAEIRGAGYTPGSAAFPALGVAEPTRLTIQHDLDGDGAIDRRGEQITWLLRGSTLRRDAGGGAQPVLEGVRVLRFTYLDAAGQFTTSPEAVRSVVISLAAVSRYARAPAASRVTTTVTTEVRLRNR
ncbi:MAG: hypothetical protein HY217_13425 [Candidatus Rokubacteria bacterium]|nr:hypothetical protein [Candidatus Rokubacteria bacterium]